jgi:hypothetical protein
MTSSLGDAILSNRAHDTVSDSWVQPAKVIQLLTHRRHRVDYSLQVRRRFVPSIPNASRSM